MTSLILLLSFLFLLTGVFIFRKLWLGALGAVIIVLVSKFSFSSASKAVYYELSNAMIIWTELILLIFGAYLFYNILSAYKHFIPFTESVSIISSRISLAIILCFFMGSFMEGIAGFGIPALLIAPLMITVGFKRVTAIVLPLAATITAVLFGALGRPLRIGLGINEPDEVVTITIILNAMPALVIPFMLTYLLSKMEQIKINWKKEWKTVLGAGVCFYVPFSLTAMLSLEFPSAIAGIAGLLLFVFVFIPTKEKISGRIWWNTFSPYLFFIVLLLSFRFLAQDTLISFAPGIKQVSIYQPGIIFIIASILVLFVLNQGHFAKHFLSLLKVSLLKIWLPAVTILLLISFTQLIAKSFSELVSSLTASMSSWQIMAQPLIGISGSFITGSATMSNLLFAGSLNTTALGQKPLFMSLLHTGGAIGNAISLQNIIMVKSVIPDNISESRILKFNLPIIGIYVVLVLISTLIYVR
ncbi:MAG: L-lactate permease [Flavobacterium micromati]|nr:L-lactate permease [Flavobacterium micromati]